MNTWYNILFCCDCIWPVLRCTTALWWWQIIERESRRWANNCHRTPWFGEEIGKRTKRETPGTDMLKSVWGFDPLRRKKISIVLARVYFGSGQIQFVVVVGRSQVQVMTGHILDAGLYFRHFPFCISCSSFLQFQTFLCISSLSEPENMELSASNKHVEYEEECVLYNFDWSIIRPPVGLRCVRFWRVGGAAEVKESLTANMGEGAGFSLASLAPCANGSVIYLVKCIFQEFLKFIVNATFVPGRVKSVTLSVVQRLKSVTCFVCGQIIVHTSSPASCSFLTWDLVHAQSCGKHFQEVKKSLFLDLSWSNVSDKSVIGHNFPRRIWVASFFLVSKAGQRTVNEGRSCAVIIVCNQ